MEKLNLRAPFHMTLGYGHVAGNLARALKDIVDLSIIPMGSPFLTTKFDEFHALCNKTPGSQSDCLVIWHEYALIEHCLGRGRYIGYPFFELNQLDSTRLKNLNYVDHIVVASDWARDVLLNNHVKKPVSVISPGVDTEVFFPGNDRSEEPTYRFLNVGKYEERKCTRLIADLFNKAFEPADNVELIFHCDSALKQIREQVQSFKQYCGGLKLADKIKFSDIVQTDIALANIMREVDCGLFLSRSEGFGLPMLQMIACGKPIIGTNYSGHTQFLDTKNSLGVPITNFVPARDGIWFNGTGTWADIDKKAQDLTVDYMKGCYLNKVRENLGFSETVEKFTWAGAARQVKGL